jgi:hypothetical protein
MFLITYVRGGKLTFAFAGRYRSSGEWFSGTVTHGTRLGQWRQQKQRIVTKPTALVPATALFRTARPKRGDTNEVLFVVLLSLPLAFFPSFTRSSVCTLYTVYFSYIFLYLLFSFIFFVFHAFSFALVGSLVLFTC